MNFERVRAICVFSFCVFFSAVSLLGQRDTVRNSAWEVLLHQNPEAVEDASINWQDRLVMDALTPQQAQEYFNGADPSSLTTIEGNSLEEYLAAKLHTPAHVYVPLASACRLFSSADSDTGPGIQILQSRGSDLSLQGGSAFGCAIPEEASNLVLHLQVESGSGLSARVKLWSADGPEPAGMFEPQASADSALSYEMTQIVGLCAGCSQGEFQLKLSEAAAVTGEVVGYFRPMTPADSPGGGISFLTEGASNNFFGTGAGSVTTGIDNSFFGAVAGLNNTTGARNSYFGSNAGGNGQTGSNNSYFGVGAGTTNNGSNNSMFGELAGNNSTGSDNSFFGRRAGYQNTGARNSFFGEQAGDANNSGQLNSFFGSGAGGANTTGSFNSFFGEAAGESNTGSCCNAYFGRGAGESSTGEENTFIGNIAGRNNTSGYENVSLGFNSGSSSTVEFENTFIGTRANLNPGTPGTVTNATALGYRSYVSQSNSLVLGSIAGQNDASADVKVGIGTTAPEEALHVARSDGTAKLLVEETSGTTAARFLFQLINNGGSRFSLKNSNSLKEWFFSMDGSSDFNISLVGTGGPELLMRKDGTILMGPGASTVFNLSPTGNLEIGGALTEFSDRNAKKNIQAVDGQQVLEKLVQLPLAEWTYKTDEDGVRHLGPMAQDFRAAFGLGQDERHLATLDTSGVSLAAIQGLHQVVREKETQLEEHRREIDTLKTELAEIKQMLGTR